jgi:hypothetical protein
MKTSETQTELLKAVFAARKAIPIIPKNKKGQAGNRTFMYSAIEDILEAIRQPLEDNNLLITQPPDGYEIITRLEHVLSGEWREARMPLNSEHANNQSFGIEITYRRRYAIPMILGIATEEDTDAAGEKNRKRGIDNTRNANGTAQGVGSHSAPRMAFESLQPEVQEQLRRVAPQVEQAMPDVRKCIEVAGMCVDSYSDQDYSDMIKPALWYLLDSKTRTAISKETKK